MFARLHTPDPINHARARIIWGRALTAVGDVHLAAVELSAGLTARPGPCHGCTDKPSPCTGWANSPYATSGRKEAVGYLRQAEACSTSPVDTEAVSVRQLLQATTAGDWKRQ